MSTNLNIFETESQYNEIETNLTTPAVTYIEEINTIKQMPIHCYKFKTTTIDSANARKYGSSSNVEKLINLFNNNMYANSTDGSFKMYNVSGKQKYIFYIDEFELDLANFTKESSGNSSPLEYTDATGIRFVLNGNYFYVYNS